MSHEELIRTTFSLARRGLGMTWPNPLVGAVVVKDGRVIGMGFHRFYGGDHAEVDALKNCSESPAGATVYVNLEPCCHTNKQTPPCAQFLIREKVRKVVISNLDPNPAVNGAGVRLLREAGIDVVTGVLEEEGELVNEAFFHSQRTGLPFVHMKMGTTLDGRIALANGDSRWITGEAAREDVQRLRSQHQAILVGAETARKDDPMLTVRLPGYAGTQPRRVVFTQHGDLPATLKLFTDEHRERSLVYTERPLKRPLPGIEVIEIRNLEEALRDLSKRKLVNVLLEGGSHLAGSFLQAGLINRVTLYLNPSFLGEGPGAVSNIGVPRLDLRPKLRNVQINWIGEDLMLTGRID
jgi:diaminohydroxyphosphoribosylaminopyrimidine deaminase/5-amino-6-(5-phosphoribosylamino)uracil reductase